MGGLFLYQENPATAESPPYEEGGTIANGDQGEKKTSPVSSRTAPS